MTKEEHTAKLEELEQRVTMLELRTAKGLPPDPSRWAAIKATGDGPDRQTYLDTRTGQKIVYDTRTGVTERI